MFSSCSNRGEAGARVSVHSPAGAGGVAAGAARARLPGRWCLRLTHLRPKLRASTARLLPAETSEVHPKDPLTRPQNNENLTVCLPDTPHRGGGPRGPADPSRETRGGARALGCVPRTRGQRGRAGAGPGKGFCAGHPPAVSQAADLPRLRLCAVEFSDLPVPQNICGASSGHTGVFSSRLFRRRDVHFYLIQSAAKTMSLWLERWWPSGNQVRPPSFLLKMLPSVAR